MACSGLHCAGCAGGITVPVVPLAAVFGLAWVAEHLIEVAAVCGACGALSVLVVVALMRWGERQDARHAQIWAARKAALEPPSVTATVIPQVRWPDQPVIEYHHHGAVFNFYGPDGETQAARVIRAALPGQAGDRIITEEQ
jgi:hypothetical protein